MVEIQGYTLLHAAARGNLSSVVDRLVAMGLDLNAKDVIMLPI